MNSQQHDAMNGWNHLHSCNVAAESTDMSPVSDFAHASLQHSLKSALGFCDETRRRSTAAKKSVNCFFRSKITKIMLRKCGNLLGCTRGLTDFGSWRSGEQLVGKPIADACRQARLWQQLTASPPSISTHTLFNKCCPFIWNWMWQPYVISL